MISALRISTVQQNVVRVFPSSAKAEVGFSGAGCSPRTVTKAPTFQGFEKPEENVERSSALPEKSPNGKTKYLREVKM